MTSPRQPAQALESEPAMHDDLGDTSLRLGSLEINLHDRRLLRDQRLVRLSRIEWALLDVLIRHAGTTLSHRWLLRRVWGEAYGEECEYLRVYVRVLSCINSRFA